jgi:hypothetical protein
MGLLNKAAKAEQPVTREEFEALRGSLLVSQKITALALHAVCVAMKAAPGYPDANPRRRLELLAPAAGLEPAETAQLQALLKELDRAAKAESQREFAEAQERIRPRRGEDFRVPSWRG